MLCDRCGKMEATIQYVQIINGSKQEIYLCSRCGKEVGVDDFSMPIDLSTFFGEIFGEYNIPRLNRNIDLICNNCKTSFEEFLNTGKIGCANCYKSFEKKLNPILKRIQGGNEYLGESKQETTIGKIKKEQEDISNDNTIKELENQIKKYVKEEKYEEAAKIRDEIKRIKEKGGNN